MSDPALSPHQDLAERLAVAIADWDNVPDGWSVERAYGIEKFFGKWEDSFSGRIVTVVSGVESQRIANLNQDDVTLSVAYLRKLEATASTEAMDLADLQCDQLRTFLQGSDVKTIRIPDWSTAGNRVNTSLPTPYSSEMATTASLFVAIIQTTYRVLRMNAT